MEGSNNKLNEIPGDANRDVVNRLFDPQNFAAMYHNFTPQQLAQQYSPSSCIEDINVYIQEYIVQSKSNTLKARKGKSLLTDLAYFAHPDTKLDLYLPTAAAKKMLHVYIHGGYWQELSKETSSFAANNFQSHGYHFAVIGYSLAPNATMSEIVEQVRHAIAWLYQNAEKFGYKRDEIHLSGSSAGAHLAMMMLLTEWKYYLPPGASNIIKSILAVSGIYDLTPIVQTYINEPIQLTAQEIAENSPLLMQVVSPIPPAPHVVIAFGENETDEFKRQSNEMYLKLQQLGYPVTFKEIMQRNHFDVILDLGNSNSWLFQQVIK